MNDTKFDHDKIIQYWLKSSDEDFETMMILFKSNKFTWSFLLAI